MGGDTRDVCRIARRREIRCWLEGCGSHCETAGDGGPGRGLLRCMLQVWGILRAAQRLLCSGLRACKGRHMYLNPCTPVL